MPKKLKISNIIIKSVSGLLIVGIIISMIFAIIVFAKSAYNIGYSVFNQTSYDNRKREVFVTIPEGSGDKEVAERLYNNGLAHSKLVIYLQLKLSKYSKKIIPGDYKLNTSMLPDEIFMEMSKTAEDEKTDKK